MLFGEGHLLGRYAVHTVHMRCIPGVGWVDLVFFFFEGHHPGLQITLLPEHVAAFDPTPGPCDLCGVPGLDRHHCQSGGHLPRPAFHGPSFVPKPVRTGAAIPCPRAGPQGRVWPRASIFHVSILHMLWILRFQHVWWVFMVSCFFCINSVMLFIVFLFVDLLFWWHVGYSV